MMKTTEIEIFEKNIQINYTNMDKPPVIILTGLAGLAEEWWSMQNLLKDKANLIAINRFGYGKSDITDEPRTSIQIAKEVKSLIDNLNIKEKIILVGHSQGGFYAQHFAKFFPEIIKGIILVDSITADNDLFYDLNTPNFIERGSMKARIEMMEKIINIDKEVHRRMVKPMVEVGYEKFPDEIKENMIEFIINKNYIKATIDEFHAREESYAEFKKLDTFPNIPLKVLMRDPKIMIQIGFQYGVPNREATTVEELWLKQTYDLLNMNNNSELIECHGADHNIHVSKPEYVIKAIESLLA